LHRKIHLLLKLWWYL